MNEPKHTPAPWSLHHEIYCFDQDRKFGDQPNLFTIRHEKYGHDAITYWVDFPDGAVFGSQIPPAEQLANAHLIAAAPELLKELEYLVMKIDQNEEMNRVTSSAIKIQAMEIIAKAKGQYEPNPK